MPELPEVETIKRGLSSKLPGRTIEGVVVRFPKLRWPIPVDLNTKLQNQTIVEIARRGKYLLLHLSRGTLIIHLGMSGSICLIDADKPLIAHDHVDVILDGKKLLRYNDPRRFGAILWTDNWQQESLLQSIGIEPLSEEFSEYYLSKLIKKHSSAIKLFIMNSAMIAGIGNIYATEALFLASIHPKTSANTLSLAQCKQLVQAIKMVLNKAIVAGGTTLKDYINSEGKPGYFAQQLDVYGRADLPCKRCNSLLQSIQLGQRNTVFCAQCQAMCNHYGV